MLISNDGADRGLNWRDPHESTKAEDGRDVQADGHVQPLPLGRRGSHDATAVPKDRTGRGIGSTEQRVSKPLSCI